MYPLRGRGEDRVQGAAASSRRTSRSASTTRSRVAGLRLYVQRVLIMDRCEQVLPPYLRFVKGVVDSADLPLNVSRELLQQNPLLDAIQKSVVKNVLDALEGMKNAEYDKYLAFYDGLRHGAEGRADPRLGEPREDRRPAAVRDARTPRPGKFTTLAEYVEKMPDGPDGDLLPDRRVSRATAALAVPGSVPGEGAGRAAAHRPDRRVRDPAAGRRTRGRSSSRRTAAKRPAWAKSPPGDKERFAALLTALKEKLPDVADVRLTKRLTESAACLVADAHGDVRAHGAADGAAWAATRARRSGCWN